MKVFLKVLAWLGWLTALTLAPLCCEPAPKTWEYWGQIALQKRLSDSFALEVSKLSKYNGRECYYQEWDFTGIFSSRGPTVYKLGYFNSLENTGNCYQKEIDLSGSAVFNWKSGKWEISDENQFEYRFFAYTSPNYLRYLNQLTLAYPIRTKRRVLRPYLSDQAAYDFCFDQDRHCGINRNRLYLGMKSDYPDKFQLDAYYMRQTNGTALDGGQPLPVFNVWGMNLNFKF